MTRSLDSVAWEKGRVLRRKQMLDEESGWGHGHRRRSRLRSPSQSRKGEPQPEELPVLGERLPRPKLAASDGGSDAVRVRLDVLLTFVAREGQACRDVDELRENATALANSARGPDGYRSPRRT
ncbi:hypothetical protein MTO96_047303 [Rhipicephalus appendiculatus]